MKLFSISFISYFVVTASFTEIIQFAFFGCHAWTASRKMVVANALNRIWAVSESPRMLHCAGGFIGSHVIGLFARYHFVGRSGTKYQILRFTALDRQIRDALRKGEAAINCQFGEVHLG